MTADRLAKLLEKRAQLEARIETEKARQRQQARKEDTRRKIIAGALALEHAEQDPAFGETLRRLLMRYVERPADRALFGLPANADAPPTPEAPAETPAEGPQTPAERA
jgi:hypothetical protein